MGNRLFAVLTLLCSSLCGCKTAQIDHGTVLVPGGSQQAPMSESSPVLDRDSPRFQLWQACSGSVYPDGFRSVSELQGLIPEPHDIRQLLKNLKLAWDGDLLLQPSFYDPEVLKKVFAASGDISWKEPWNPLSKNVGYIVAELNSSVVSGMTVRVETRCWQSDTKGAAGEGKSTVFLLGYVTITGGPFDAMTLRVIRDVLGPETRMRLDEGQVEFGIVHGPGSKGSITYTDLAREKSAGMGLGLTFMFPFPSTSPRVVVSELADGDVVERVDLHEYKEQELR